jgi:formate C-acetyltransferase
MKRIEALRAAALASRPCRDEFYYRFYRRYGAYGERVDTERYADAFSLALEALTPDISDGELIVGKIGSRLANEEKNEWERTYRSIAREACRAAGGGQDSHMAIDYGLLLSEGIYGIIRKIESLLLHCPEEKKPFYRSCKKCLTAVIRHSEAYAREALRLANEAAEPERKKELTEIARICKRVPAYPAESFHEALQSVHFITYALSLNPLREGDQQFQLGRPDRYLYPFYKKDVESGALTREHAQLLLDCLGIQINMRVPNGLSSGYMVGGRDRTGNTVANELTEMCMQVISDIRLVYPAVGLCYTRDMPEELLKKACAILAEGRSHPAIFNDDIISLGLRCYGVPEEESHDYIHSTCVEITPIASSNVWVASPYTNMAQLLLDTMTEEYADFEEHLRELLHRLDLIIERNFEQQKRLRAYRAAHSVNPLLSCFVSDCLARGLDIEQGVARYNWVMPSFVGMANLVDSLYALKTVVYDRGEMTLSEFKKILDENFEGNEALRLRLLRRLPKYGNDADEIDGYFAAFIEHIVSECKQYEGLHTNARLVPSVFCWIMHEYFGRKTGATPDGRKKGFPLGDGSGPCQGREQSGPTASILSSTKWSHTELIGGVAVNMKFSKGMLSDRSEEVLQSLVRVYMQRGGFELQINVTDRETLERARKDPEAYRDLIVRIGGYSDYFTRLSPEMQEEIILRTEHTI